MAPDTAVGGSRRFFPAVEHARLAVEQGAIGDVVGAQADFPDRCYAAQIAPLAFGAGSDPAAVVATSRPSDGSGAAVVNYGESGSATLIFPPWTAEFKEASELTGTKGRLTLDSYGHVTRTNIRGCAAQMISAAFVLAGPDPSDDPHHP